MRTEEFSRCDGKTAKEWPWYRYRTDDERHPSVFEKVLYRLAAPALIRTDTCSWLLGYWPSWKRRLKFFCTTSIDCDCRWTSFVFRFKQNSIRNTKNNGCVQTRLNPRLHRGCSLSNIHNRRIRVDKPRQAVNHSVSCPQ